MNSPEIEDDEDLDHAIIHCELKIEDRQLIEWNLSTLGGKSVMNGHIDRIDEVVDPGPCDSNYSRNEHLMNIIHVVLMKCALMSQYDCIIDQMNQAFDEINLIDSEN